MACACEGLGIGSEGRRGYGRDSDRINGRTRRSRLRDLIKKRRTYHTFVRTAYGRGRRIHSHSRREISRPRLALTVSKYSSSPKVPSESPRGTRPRHEPERIPIDRPVSIFLTAKRDDLGRRRTARYGSENQTEPQVGALVEGREQSQRLGCTASHDRGIYVLIRRHPASRLHHTIWIPCLQRRRR